MTDTTTHLALPYILPAQAQKHVTHNEALRMLDAIVHLSVADRDLSTPPASPAEGVRYLVGSAPTGTWSGHAAEIAAFQDGAWAFFTPSTGWFVWVADEQTALVWTGTVWQSAAAANLNPAALVGVNATADTTNRLSVSSPATLFNHDGAGHQLKLNKAGAAQTASHLFQTAFSGRAEIGTTGDDNFHIKVSSDGSIWREALVVPAATGLPRIPALPKASLPAAATAAVAALVLVTDEAGGAVLAFSDGSAWRRVTDRAVVS